MQEITSTEFSKNFGKYRELAQREILAIKNHERVTGYFLSPDEYENYERLKAMMPKAYAVGELSEETVQALLASQMDSRHDHLNSLLEQ